MGRGFLLELAREGARDPSRAPRIAAMLENALKQQRMSGGNLPAGYIYEGAYQWIIQAENLDVEPLPGVANPNANPITGSSNEFIPLRVPFDALIMGAAGWCQPVAQTREGQQEVDAEDLLAANLLSCSPAGRDLFSVEFGLDGQVRFGTDGRNELMFPASSVVGTRDKPRPMAWTVRRNQIIRARFRNITNAWLEEIPDTVMQPPVLATAALALYALNLEAP